MALTTATGGLQTVFATAGEKERLLQSPDSRTGQIEL
jgi:hypothetical protein